MRDDPVVQKLLAELLRRIESGRTTSADARFLRALLMDVGVLSEVRHD